MRLLASFELADNHPDEAEIRRVVARALGKVEFDTLSDADTGAVIEQIAMDIDEDQRAQFRRTAFLACRGVEGNVLGAASLIGGATAPRMRLRFVHAEIQAVIAPGESMAAAMMELPWVASVNLTVRERKSGRSVLYGEYAGQVGGYIKYVTMVARRGRLFLALVAFGLASELALTAAFAAPGRWAQFGQRLGAPLVTTGLVGLGELYMAWNERRRRPPVTWSTRKPGHAGADLA